MDLTLREIGPNETSIFDAFAAAQPGTIAMQMAAWAQVIEAEPGIRARCVLLSDHSGPVASAVLSLRPYGPGFRGLICYGGPILKDPSSPELWRGVLAALARYGRRQRGVFLRIWPWVPFAESAVPGLTRCGMRPFERVIAHGYTRSVDLSLSPEELLAQMHSSGRRDARACERKGVQVESGTSEDLLGHFWQLYTQSNEVKGLRSRPLPTLRAMTAHGLGSVHVAMWEGQPTQGILLIHHPALPTTYYLCAGTNREVTGIPAGFLVHWKAMQWARERGFRVYDLGGIGDPADPSRGSLASVDVFKRRLGGADVRIFGEHQKALVPATLLRLAQRLRG